jgi:hypothetical protein
MRKFAVFGSLRLQMRNIRQMDFSTFSIGNIFEKSFEELKASEVLERLTFQIDRGVTA